MKLIILAFGIAATLSFGEVPSGQAPQAKAPEIRIEREEKKDEAGKVNLTTERFYRGQEQIFVSVQLKHNRYGLRAMRCYFAKGKEVLDELDYDDGRPQLIRTYQEDILCEEFTRQTDGCIKPVSSEELARLQGAQKEMLKAINGEIERR